jgi:hypothetical protein
VAGLRGRGVAITMTLRSWQQVAMSAAVVFVLSCSAARAVTVHFVNDARVPTAQVAAFEQAELIQLRQLRTFWPGDPVHFGDRGWSLEVVPRDDPRVRRYRGFHGYGPTPYAVVAYNSRWTRVASHELLEMMVNPRVQRILSGFIEEICDPVKKVSYRVQGVALSDFVTPAWFTGAPGPYDFLGRVTTAHSVRFGYATTYDPVTGSHIIGSGPFRAAAARRFASRHLGFHRMA